MSIFQDQNSPEQPAHGSGNGSDGKLGHEVFGWSEHQTNSNQLPDPGKDTQGLKEVRKELGTKIYDPQKLEVEIDGLKRTLRLAPYNQPTEREITEFRQQQEEKRKRIEKERGFFGRMFGPKNQEEPSQNMPVINVEKEPLAAEAIRKNLEALGDDIADRIMREMGGDPTKFETPLSLGKITIDEPIEMISSGNRDVEGLLKSIRLGTGLIDKNYLLGKSKIRGSLEPTMRFLSEQENKLRLQRLEAMQNQLLEIPRGVEEQRQGFLNEVGETRVLINNINDPYVRDVPEAQINLAQELVGDDTILDPDAFAQRKQIGEKILNDVSLFYLHRRRTS